MVRKRRTKLPVSGDGYNAGAGSQDDGARQGGTQQPSGMQQEDGAQRPPAVQLEGGAHYDPASQKLCNVAGTGGVPANPQQQEGHGGGSYQGLGGGCYQQSHGEYPPCREMVQQQGGTPHMEHQPQGLPQGRGEPQLYQGVRIGGAYVPARRGAGLSASETSRLPLPYLDQVTQTPPKAAPASYSGASSSRLSNVPMEQFQQLSIHTESTINQAVIPASSKALKIPPRPGKGSYGNRCVVKANHFITELHKMDLYHYDVSITPEVTSGGVNRDIMKKLVSMYGDSHFGGRRPVYDGKKNFFTAGPLPFTSKEFQVTLVDEDGGTGAERRQRNFKIVIKFAAEVDLNRLEMFLKGKQTVVPQEALQVLDIVLREFPSTRFFSVGRSFYFPNTRTPQPLGGGLERLRGFYQSLRPTQMGLSLNIDMSSAAFIQPIPVIDFILEFLNASDKILHVALNESDYSKIYKALRGVKVEVTHRGNMRRKYRITALTSETAKDLAFSVVEGGPKVTVVQYFQETYRLTIKYINMPCLQVGNQQRPNYLPMEVCKIVEGQRYSKRLKERQITALLTANCQAPRVRQSNILDTVTQNGYSTDKHAKEFGINISNELARVDARILNPPRLKYHDTGREKQCLPTVGQWNMKDKKMLNGGRVSNWICINFVPRVHRSVPNFCRELAQMCQTLGMEFASVIQLSFAEPDEVERTLKKHHQKHKKLDLLVGILPNNNGSLYGDLKRICETELGLISQCCLEKHIHKPAVQYLSNLALKINVKVGGRNTVLLDAISRRIPLVSDKPTIIFGADVTHPHPGEDSSPSIAAVVASQDWPEITNYAALVRTQAHRQELIAELYTEDSDPVLGIKHGGMIRELLKSFNRATGNKPERIIFYRDGVSEGQFQQVLEHEVTAIYKACLSLEDSYRPPVTFVVVQKRHHTRLFPDDPSRHQSTDNSGNILPGTVVDSKICHPTEFDFYLCSHAGIKGTSRPAHYHVLWDDNKFSADELQTLTNNLCYTYARCTRSVSIVPPAYYAHLAAFRARFYMEAERSGVVSVPSGPRITRVNRGPVRPLPAIKDNVQRVMFFC